MIRRLRDYYRQFEELSPEEISRGLREQRDAERASALAEVPPLDLASPAWHEPPDPEAVNAATYALRRAVNTYPDDSPLRDAIAARHDVRADQSPRGMGRGSCSMPRSGRSAAAGGSRSPGRAGGRCHDSSTRPAASRSRSASTLPAPPTPKP